MACVSDQVLSDNKLVWLLFYLRLGDTAFSAAEKPYYHGLLKDSGSGGKGLFGRAVSFNEIVGIGGENLTEGTHPGRNRIVHDSACHRTQA